MAKARSSPVDSLLTSAAELRLLERWAPLALTLRQALAAATSDAQSRAVLAEVLRVPPAVRAGTPAWQTLSLWAWCVNRAPEPMLAFAEGLALPPEAEVYHAWALVRTGRAQEAQRRLDQVWAQLSGEALGFAWRTRGQALATLGQPGWLTAFEAAGGLLQGRRRSLCLAEQGHELDQSGQGAEAREVWREALAGLADDVFHQAWLRFNLGVSAFRDGAPEAEQHFLQLVALSRQAPAQPFASRAWTGLGTFRRLQGEWTRAEAAYRQAVRAAGADRDDAFQAWRGIGHLQRLRGLPELALEDFGRAAELSGERTRWIHVDVAGVRAQLAQPERAAQALARSGALDGVDAARAALVRAELGRQRGDHAASLAVVRGLDLRGAWAGEERRCYPDLFGLAEQAGLALPPAIRPLERNQVEVQAAGVLRVQVNGRPVPIPPTGRAAELLVALLELGRAASVEALVAMLYPAAGRDERGPRQQISALARTLRQALGWPTSVTAQRGAYALDPEASWVYDVQALRQANSPLPGFLEGVYSEWVRERQVNEAI